MIALARPGKNQSVLLTRPQALHSEHAMSWQRGSHYLRPAGLSWMFASELISGALGFLVMVHLARRLGPSSFARLEYAAAVAAWLLVVVRGGVDVIATREAGSSTAIGPRLDRRPDRTALPRRSGRIRAGSRFGRSPRQRSRVYRRAGGVDPVSLGICHRRWTPGNRPARMAGIVPVDPIPGLRDRCLSTRSEFLRCWLGGALSGPRRGARCCRTAFISHSRSWLSPAQVPPPNHADPGTPRFDRRTDSLRQSEPLWCRLVGAGLVGWTRVGDLCSGEAPCLRFGGAGPGHSGLGRSLDRTGLGGGDAFGARIDSRGAPSALEFEPSRCAGPGLDFRSMDATSLRAGLSGRRPLACSDRHSSPLVADREL